MFKRIVWVMVLLVMTACTILFTNEPGTVGIDPTPSPVVNETLEPTAVEIIPTEIMNPTAEPTATATEIPTQELTTAPMETEPPIEITPLPTVPYIVQPGSPIYMANFNYLEKGCAWQGVAGQVFGANGKPIKNLIVKVSGMWNGVAVSEIAVTGMISAKPYGPGSYEVVLGDVAIKSTTPLYVQVFDIDETPLTEPIEFYTKAKCNRNLVLINFIKN
jgi:hypothetical protein